MATSATRPDPGARLGLAAALLAAGMVIFWAGAFTPPYRWWFPISTEEFLRLVAAHPLAWRWIAAAFAAGVLVTLAGFSVLKAQLRAAGDQGRADLALELGHAAFLLGSVLWLASIAFRATVTVQAARTTGVSGIVPAWFEPLRDWSGLLFAIYMPLAYLAVAAFGWALVLAGAGPRWAAKAQVVFGLVGALGFLARIPIFNPPLMIHLAPGVFGLAVLLQLRRRTTGG